MPEARERPPPFLKTSMVGPLGGDAGRMGESTTNLEDFDGRPCGRQCRMPESAHHQSHRCRWWAPWEAMSEAQEHPPPMSKTSMASPLGSDAGSLIATTTNPKHVTWQAPGGPASIHVQRCVVTCMGSIDRSNSTHGFHSPCKQFYYVLRPLVSLRGMGNSVRRYLCYGYGLAQGHVPFEPPVLSCQC
jgi:hypothetical protein